jgi:uncharacterized repeat protein (TIGR01451 family)
VQKRKLQEKTSGRNMFRPYKKTGEPENTQQPNWRSNMKQHRIKSIMTIGLAATLLAGIAWAQPQVTLSLTAEKEVTVEEDGRQVTRLVPVTEAAPGEVLIYTVTYANSGTEAAGNVALDNPIPTNATYMPGSATAGEGQELTFSIDGGSSYQRPNLLTYTVTLPDGRIEQRVASPEMYTHIRWSLATIPPSGRGNVSFQVTVD